MLDLITFGKMEQDKRREKDNYAKRSIRYKLYKRKTKGIIRIFNPLKQSGKLS